MVGTACASNKYDLLLSLHRGSLATSFWGAGGRRDERISDTLGDVIEYVVWILK